MRHLAVADVDRFGRRPLHRAAIERPYKLSRRERNDAADPVSVALLQGLDLNSRGVRAPAAAGRGRGPKIPLLHQTDRILHHRWRHWGLSLAIASDIGAG